MQTETSREILERFLTLPVSDGAGVFEEFKKLPGAVAGTGSKPLERYVYVPGKRKKGIVLVAHADTVWDQAYGRQEKAEPVFQDGVYQSGTPDCGIGADDRAGCAMLWALRDSGHSLLVVDGEEKGKVGAKFLCKQNKKLFRKLNRHCFMMELDWRGTGGCLYNQVENTKEFKDYIAAELGFVDDAQKGGCDLQILCQRICGVNVGVGYRNHHTAKETLVVAEWETTYQKLSEFLEKEHQVFSIPCSKQLRAGMLRFKALVGRVLRKLKLRK